MSEVRRKGWRRIGHMLADAESLADISEEGRKHYADLLMKVRQVAADDLVKILPPSAEGMPEYQPYGEGSEGSATPDRPAGHESEKWRTGV